MTIIEALVQLRKDIQTWVRNNLAVKLNTNLGSENANKVLTTDEEGNVIAEELSIDITIDNEFSETSENPLQNKVVTAEFTEVENALLNKLDKKFDTSKAGEYLSVDDNGNVTTKPINVEEVDLSWSSIEGKPFDQNNKILESSLPSSIATDDDVSAVKNELSEHITSDSDSFSIVDPQGNIVGTISAEGLNAFNVLRNGKMCIADGDILTCGTSTENV